MEIFIRLSGVSILCLILASSCVLTEDLQNPGIRLMVTKKGLDYLNQIGLDIVTHLIESQLEGRNIKGSIKKYFINLDFQNITLEKLEVQELSLFSDPVTGLNLILTGVDLNISADIGISGSLQSSVSLDVGSVGLSLHLGVRINRTDKGQPSFSITTCSFQAGQYHIQFSGDGSAFYNEYVMNTIKKYLDDGKKLCDLARSHVEDALRGLLPDPPVAKIEKYAGISYALYGDPIFTSEYIVAELEGDFCTVDIPNIKPPFIRSSLPPFQAGDCEDKMACLWVTEYVANTASVVFKRTGNLVFNVTDDTIEDIDDHKKKKKKKKKKKDSLLKLDTGTFSLIVPQLFHRFPDQSLTLTVRAVKEVPYVNITETQVVFTIPADIDVYVNNSKQKNYPVAFTMRVAASINATVGVANVTLNKTTFTLTANATQVKISVSGNGSNIDSIDYKKINKLITVFKLIEENVIPSLNKQAERGFGIKLINNLTFVEPNLTYFKGGLLLGADFNYEIT